MTVFVELPQADPSYGWEAAADEVAAAELRIKLRTGGVEAHLFPSSATLAAWIDARARPRGAVQVHRRACTTPCATRSAEGFEQHGFLNVLLATVRAFDGASRDDTVATLEERDATRLGVTAEEVARARRWFTSFGTCSVVEPLADLPPSTSSPTTHGAAAMTETTWVEGAAGSLFDLDNLPYGVFSATGRGGDDRRVGVRIGDHVLDLAPVAEIGDPASALAAAWRTPSLNAFMAMGPEQWAIAREWIVEVLGHDVHEARTAPHVHPLTAVELHLPIEVGDYVDFYASEHHASNVGRIFRPDQEPLLPNWKHLPVGYHGRSGTVVA